MRFEFSVDLPTVPETYEEWMQAHAIAVAALRKVLDEVKSGPNVALAFEYLEIMTTEEWGEANCGLIGTAGLQWDDKEEEEAWRRWTEKREEMLKEIIGGTYSEPEMDPEIYLRLVK